MLTARKVTRMTVGTFHLTPAADWPPSLHKAAERYEQANLIVGNARDAGAFNAALAELQAAERAYGAECLALDKARRPDFYASTAE